MSDIPSRISLREVGPRDGLQNEDPVPTPAKIALIDRLGHTGVSRIEAVSFVRPSAIPQMADADEVWAGVARVPTVRYSALAPNLRGARRALDAGFTEVEVVVSASDTHNRKNVNRSTEQSLDEIAGRMAANSPVAVKAAKRAIRQGADADLAAALEVEDAAWRTAALSADRREGIAAFNEKRQPNWPRE